MVDTEDGKVTLAVLNSKLDTVLKTLDRYADDHDRIGRLEGVTEGAVRGMGNLKEIAEKLDERARGVEIQVAKMGVVYGVVGGSISAAATLLIGKVLGL
jgi:archaellum component FlaC